MNAREAYIALNLAPGIGPARVSALIKAFGSPEAVFDRTADEIASVKGISSALAGKIIEAGTSGLDDELNRVERGQTVRVVTLADDDYPPQLRELDDAPLCLYICGTLPDAMPDNSIAIVGSRRVTAYGARMARHLSESAVFSGWSVVSGLAIGTDSIAHKAAVDAGGKTVAVLGGGLMDIQPAENVGLAKRILETGGAIVTEFPMAFYPTRHSFPMRNRIISGLTCGTIVVEAGIRSGALITAAAATEQGKSVYALPGNADSELSAGCNELIKTGAAALITSFEDVLDNSDFLPGFGGNDADVLKEEPSLFKTQAEDESVLPETDRLILDFLRKNGDSLFDEISGGTGIPADKLSRKLTALEIGHRVSRQTDGRFRRSR